MTTLYDFSGGMESAAMIYLCRDEIKENSGIVRWADTGKQFPEMGASLNQIAGICGNPIHILAPPMTFDEYLFERGGMLRQGYSDCSKRMKRRSLREHMNSFEKPVRVAIGFNAKELERAEKFSELNDKDGIEFFYPLIERNIKRKDTVEICQAAGFTILLAMYQKMGRFDCFFCPNQRIAQAEKVMKHYPELWAEWKQIEKRKGHSILGISAEAIEGRHAQGDFIAALDQKQSCSCMGGDEP